MHVDVQGAAERLDLARPDAPGEPALSDRGGHRRDADSNESVTVEVGKDTTLTLSQSSSPVPADRFPPPAASGAEGSPGSQRE